MCSVEIGQRDKARFETCPENFLWWTVHCVICLQNNYISIIYIYINYIYILRYKWSGKTGFVIYMTGIRVKQTGSVDTITSGNSYFGYIRKKKQYYLSLMEYTFSATSPADINACVLGWAFELFPFQRFKILVRVSFVLFSILWSWEEDPKEVAIILFSLSVTLVVD